SRAAWPDAGANQWSVPVCTIKAVIEVLKSHRPSRRRHIFRTGADNETRRGLAKRGVGGNAAKEETGRWGRAAKRGSVFGFGPSRTAGGVQQRVRRVDHSEPPAERCQPVILGCQLHWESICGSSRKCRGGDLEI